VPCLCYSNLFATILIVFNADEDDSFLLDDDEEVHKADDVVPQIYACATMWHETRSEMTQLLKSMFR
jgi:chitin synthase